VGVPLVAGARLPLAFIAGGLVALATGAGTVVAAPQLLLLPHTHPGVVALAHLWLPGFLLSVSMGAVYQLMPVVLGTPLRLPLAAAWCHLVLHGAGVPLLAGGFAVGRFDLVAAGGVLVSGGIGILAAGTWRTFLASARRDAIGWSFPLAVTWLAGAVLFGLVLAINRRTSFLPWSVLDLLRAHAHVGLGGFFLTLLQGATFQLVPMFTLADLVGLRWVGAGLMLVQAGLLVLAPGLALGLRAVGIVGALLVVAGLGCSGVALRWTLRARRKQVLDPGVKGFTAGALVLGVAALGGLLLAVGNGSSPGGGPTAYGTAIVAGALSLMVMGMLCKIVPFLVWMKVYGPRAGRQPVPLAGSLGSRTLETAWLWLHGAALVALVAGVGWNRSALTALGGAVFAVAVALFLADMLRVFRHLFRPRAGAAAPLRPSVSIS
jgi:hypothetical protein